uniref:Expansin-like B1 n=1 Tax=Stylosanthes guianensis TaxID=62615 RepID=A0A6B9W2L0_9FABA|nr:expansin-like B1 [Stylosanthes guianensis]
MELISFNHKLGIVCVILLVLNSALLCCFADSYTKSRASYYNTPDGYGNPWGACGYGEYGRTLSGGNVAAVSGSLWKGGSGCGACYQIRCKIGQYCDEDGTQVVVTDYGEGDRTDFIMTEHAFSNLARDSASSAKLKKYGVMDIEYKRVSCKYSKSNVLLKLHENSNNPYYFAILLLNVGGKCDVAAVQLWLEDKKEWSPLRRVYGTVFDYENPPGGKITLRIQMDCAERLVWEHPKKPIPSNWNAGQAYDTGLQF